MDLIVLDPVIEYLDGPTIRSTRDVLALRVNKHFNQYITTSKALTMFWVKMHRRTSHINGYELLYCCSGLDIFKGKKYRQNSIDMTLRELCRKTGNECPYLNDQHRTPYIFQPVHGDDRETRKRELYTEWRALAYKRLGRTWNAMKDKKLEKLRAQVAAMEEERAAFEKRRAFYAPLVQSENKRIKKILKMNHLMI
jgi:hypothetical protein